MATMQGEAVDFTPPATVAVEQRREIIGDYEILGKLGQGGMGAVYRARQISLDRVVALKILPSHLEEDENFVARFQREAAVAAGLNHPNLVQVYASGCSEGCHFIAMELVEGENLRQRVKRGGLPMAEALHICLEVARGLQFAWQRAQLIHRDIKPSNIYLAEGGTVKVGDLGLAKSLLSNTTGLTHTGAAIGTPHYISPEQARGEKTIDLRADIYSLGCTLYELLTGATPYRGTDPLTVMSMHLNSPPPAIMKVLPRCPMPVGRLVNKMLRKSRHERPQSYEELIAAMEAAQAQLELGPTGASPLVSAWRQIGAAGGLQRGSAPTPAGKAPTQPALPAARRKKPALWMSAALLVLGVALGIIYLGRPAPPKPAPPRPTAAKAGAPETEAPKPAGIRGDAAAPASPAAKDGPFTNSLGMKFVPVPITYSPARQLPPVPSASSAGPTDRQRVLFSVWETRVKDFSAFASETKREWPHPLFPQGPTHPAVNVSWNDAQAFCAWLTERERKAGELGANERYRLPSDHEWSCAVGIGDRENAASTPAEKHRKLPGLYPWGPAWPPPAGTGNFSGEEAAETNIGGTHKLIAGYRDDFRYTAPVGTFPANALGLFDLTGNAREWCEDRYEPGNYYRVNRGGSWFNGTSADLLSSDRGADPPTMYTGFRGFRVVLAPAPAP
ncbi:MAG TPA: bifunctional serine/threonine-protein kinase/formylglycine-generating enzyme family protein [Chthoniobacteraceae bacterium]|jgi:serine/threonine-protein kinase|nr:bifunctional serine/threonine-protein kinase/formylglycine-generating enzyme family protein [Chthoniobacteraceae bacterium]